MKINKPKNTPQAHKIVAQKQESSFAKVKRIVDLLNQKSIWIALFVFLIPFILRRLPFYLYTPTLRSFAMEGDVWGYFDVVNHWDLGLLPHTEIRSIGYPLFLKLTWLFSETHLATVIGQSIFTLLACCLLIYGFYKHFKGFSILAAIALVFYVNSGTNMWYECSNMSECVCTASFLTFFGLTLIAMGSEKKWVWILLGFSAWYAIVVRPNGIYVSLVPIPFLIYHYVKKISLRLPLLSLSVVLSLLFSVCTYNYFNGGLFTISVFSSYSKLGVACANNALTKSNSYEPFVNEVIDSCKKLSPAYDNFASFVSFAANSSFGREKMKTIGKDSARYTMNHYLLSYMNQVSSDALSFEIRKSHFVGMLSAFFGDAYSNMYPYSYGRSFTDELKFRIQNRYLSLSKNEPAVKNTSKIPNLDYWWFHTPLYHELITNKQNYKQAMFKELYYLNYPKFPDYVKVVDNQLVVDLEENWIVRTSYKFENFLAQYATFTTKGTIMTYLTFLALVFSLVLLVLTKFRSKVAILALIFSAAYVMHGIIISTTGNFERRYWYVIYFTTYFSVIFLILMSLELRKFLKTKELKF